MMNTKILMIVSVTFLTICGISFQFFPHEILRYFDIEAGGIVPLVIQLVGALYLGFAMMNWMAKSLVIGGIYARPLAMGNFVHFTVGALALLKFSIRDQATSSIVIAATIYSVFAIVFAIVLFTHPRAVKDGNSK